MIAFKSRIYSLKEIYQMCEEGFTEEFVLYYERAPQHIKKLIYYRASEAVRHQLQLPEGENELEDKIVHECLSINCKDIGENESIRLKSTDMREAAKEDIARSHKKSKIIAVYRPENRAENLKDRNIDTTSEKKAEVELKNQKTSTETTIEECNTSPYSNLNFGWKIDVDELWLNETNDTKCVIHNRPFKQIQVMTRFAKTKMYGVVLECCEECKKLYITENKLKECERIFKKKGIRYHVEKGEYKNER